MTNRATLVKRSLQLTCIIGMALLVADFVTRWPPRYLMTPSVALFRVSMVIGSWIMRTKAAKNAKAGNAGYWYLSLDIRFVCEFAAFGLLFLSFSGGLASRVNCQLVRSLPSAQCLIHTLNGVVFKWSVHFSWHCTWCH